MQSAKGGLAGDQPKKKIAVVTTATLLAWSVIFACVGDEPTPALGVGGNPDGATSSEAGGNDGPVGNDANAGDASTDATCADFDCDPKNCGRSGHDCLGGACVKGACEPVVIASGQLHPTYVVVEDDVLYWSTQGTLTASSCTATTDGTIMRAKVDGSQQAAIATGQKCANGFVLTTTDIYWTVQGNGAFNDGAILHAPKNGTGATPLYSGLVQPVRLAADSTFLYFTTANNGAADDIYRAPLAGGGAVVKMAGGLANVAALALSGSRLFWTSVTPGAIGTVDLSYAVDAGPDAAGAPINLPVDAGYPIGLVAPKVAGAGSLYWTDRDLGVVNRIDTTSLAANPIASNQSTPNGVAVDDTFAYWWSAATGVLWRGSRDGTGTPIKVASQATGPAHLTLDDRSIYVSNHDKGTIFRIAKP